jgi:peptide/nickel transport system ATP-binding protein
VTLLALRDLRVRVGAGHGAITAVDGVDLDVPPGAVVGLVGESGSGKSTLARAIVGFTPADRGQVVLDGRDYRGARGRRIRELRRRVQLVFQDPRSSLNPRMTVGEALGEVIGRRGRSSRATRRSEIAELLGLVALEPAYARARPGALSGGERQRVALARALAADPDVIVADEVTSALDVSIQASILNLLRDVRSERGLSILFISHNLSVVRYMSDEIAVMQLGRVVERGPTEALMGAPMHPYTRVLMESASLEGLDEVGEELGEAPDPLHPPSGCRFRTVCPVGPLASPDRRICVAEDPGRTAGRRVHQAACHFAPLASSNNNSHRS